MSKHEPTGWYVNRGHVQELWDGFDVVRELPPPTYTVRCHGIYAFKARTKHECRHCKWRPDCAENTQRGGAAMCETMVVVRRLDGVEVML